MTDGLRIALAQARLGREVFPVEVSKAGSKYRKVPLVKWQQAATTDEAKIEGWWERYPGAMPGWKLPDGVIVADVDDQAAFDRTGRTLPDAPSQRTISGGLHRLYQGVGRQTVKEVPGLDTRVGGKGFVVLYSAEAFLGEAPRAPVWMIGPRDEPADDPGEDRGSVAWDALEAGELFIGAGGRDNALASLAGSLARLGTPRKALALTLRLLDAAGAIEQPPGDKLTRRDFERIAASIAATEERKVKTAHDPDPVEWLSEVDMTEAPPLLLGRLDPEGHTILFGDGGTGKGVVSAYWASKLTRTKEWAVLVLDWERNTKIEWGPRIKAFGGDLDAVRIMQPTKPIWDMVEEIHAQAAYIRSVYPDRKLYVIIDSATYACAPDEAEKSVTAAKYSKAIAEFDFPILSLAHVTKSNADPNHPFGSIFWSNGARLTVCIVGRGSEARVLTYKKSNQRATPKPLTVDWSWSDTGELPSGLIEIDQATALDPKAGLMDPDRGYTWSELKDLWGVTKANTTMIINRLRQKGQIVERDNLNWVVLPEAASGLQQRAKPRLRASREKDE